MDHRPGGPPPGWTTARVDHHPGGPPPGWTTTRVDHHPGGPAGSPRPGRRTRPRAATGSRAGRGRASTAGSGGSRAGRPPGGPAPPPAGATSSLDRTQEAGPVSRGPHGPGAKGFSVRPTTGSQVLVATAGSLRPPEQTRGGGERWSRTQRSRVGQ